jgi:hypothetical protein
MLHLADDREQEECRVLMKFWWQLAMTYQELTEADLDRHVGPAKRETVQELIDAIRHSPEAIDTWIADTAHRFPIVRDRGYEAHRSRTSPADAAVAADLVPAGLEFLGRIDGRVTLPLPVPPPYHSPASCGGTWPEADRSTCEADSRDYSPNGSCPSSPCSRSTTTPCSIQPSGATEPSAPSSSAPTGARTRPTDLRPPNRLRPHVVIAVSAVIQILGDARMYRR